ncbi:hypothetical protein BJ742DRAFT_128160 [Cladochytrium replicatum]|nr:hypothetical protein BJ742DRAFT_128160 [Cladochytrium replicatum]
MAGSSASQKTKSATTTPARRRSARQGNTTDENSKSGHRQSTISAYFLRADPKSPAKTASPSSSKKARESTPTSSTSESSDGSEERTTLVLKRRSSQTGVQHSPRHEVQVVIHSRKRDRSKSKDSTFARKGSQPKKSKPNPTRSANNIKNPPKLDKPKKRSKVILSDEEDDSESVDDKEDDDYKQDTESSNDDGEEEEDEEKSASEDNDSDDEKVGQSDIENEPPVSDIEPEPEPKRRRISGASNGSSKSKRKTPMKQTKLFGGDDNDDQPKSKGRVDEFEKAQRELPPLSDINDMFADMIERHLDTFKAIVEALGGRKLRVGTMCSGTESPLLALDLIGQALKRNHGIVFEVDHVFSCEIEPYKQAYIERNFAPPVLFRDICELGQDEAHTAYGSLVSVPGETDMIIAGTSCVDFSNLNNQKQTLSAKGESGTTFRGLLDYVKKNKPPIIINENVVSAPWEEMKKEYAKIGYVANFNRIDTKQFYIPHTRQRGYLVAVPKSFKDVPDQWVDMVNEMKRFASCTLEAFLLPSDDPRIVEARQKFLIGDNNRRRDTKVDWTRCETRHQKYRREELLGLKRPFTLWDEGGNCQLPDFAWTEWAKGQVDRVLDLMDISYLRLAKRGIDASYKTQIWNLSQNVDRTDVSRTKMGICPCLTPNMIPYLSNRGGPIIGLEALSMQGLPIDQLLLTQETMDQLADLAGNAMSTTVVGATMISALYLVRKAFSKSGEQAPEKYEPMDLDSANSTDGAKVKDVEKLNKRTLGFDQLEQANVDEFLKIADLSRRMCICEGRSGIARGMLSECEVCAYTSCERCGGRPEHHYGIFERFADRIVPSEFEKFAKERLPMKIVVKGVDRERVICMKREAAQGHRIDEALWKKWLEGFEKTVDSEFRYHRMLRQDGWTMQYDAGSTGLLELYIDGKRAEWLLFAKPDANEPAKSAVRTMFQQPLARMRVESGMSMMTGKWEVCLPGEYEFDVHIRGVGELIPAWENTLGLEGDEYREKMVRSQVEVDVDEDIASNLERDIRGLYTNYPRCGMPMASLHKRESESEAAPLYFFQDPQPCTEGNMDSFVFSEKTSRIAYGETRPICASIDASWRQSASDEVETVRGRTSRHWISCADMKIAVMSTAEDRMATVAVANEATMEVEVGQCDCERANALLAFEIPHVVEDGVLWRNEGCFQVGKTHERVVYDSIAWLTERVRNLEGLNEWRSITLPEEICVRCGRCAPSPPEICWKRSSKTHKLIPVENVRQAGPYEQALKARPAPFVTEFEKKAGMGFIRIGLNVAGLVHRAIAALPGSVNVTDVRVLWRLVPSYVPPLTQVLEPLALKSNKNDPEHSQPPRFAIPLRKEQLRSLSWMAAQEADDAPPFIEEETSEAYLGPMQWLAEARAEVPVSIRGGVLADEVGYGKTVITLGLIDSMRDIDRAVMEKAERKKGLIPVRGTLVIVPAQLVRQWQGEIEKFLPKECKVIAIVNLSHLNAVSVKAIQQADIVVMSSSVFVSDNYKANLAGFAGTGPPPSAEGRRYSQWFEKAMGLLKDQVERLVEGGGAKVAYEWMKDALDAKWEEDLFGVLVGETRKKGKTYREKQEAKETKEGGEDAEAEEAEEAKEKEGGKAVAKKTSGTKSNRKRKADASEDELEYESGDAVESDDFIVDDEDDKPKKKGKGAAKGGNKNPLYKHKISKDHWGLSSAAARRDWREMKSPVLQMFEWNRLVVDEYTYQKGQIQDGIMHLAARKRWVLSGTPPLGGFDDIKSIAVFLGVNLGTENEQVFGRKASKDKTGSELFRAYSEARTAAWHERRHEVAQRFLDQFVRQNIAEIDEIPWEEHIVHIDLPAAERAIYLELEHHIQAVDGNIKKGRFKGESDKASRLKEVLGESKTAEEALIKRCSHFDLDIDEGVENASIECNTIVSERKRQRDETLDELRRHLMVAWYNENRIGNKRPNGEMTHFKDWVVKLKTQNILGDSEATTDILAVIDEVQKALKRGDKVPKLKRRRKGGPRKVLAKVKESEKGKKKSKGKKGAEDSDEVDEDESEVEEPVPKSLSVPEQIERHRAHFFVVKDLAVEYKRRLQSLRYFEIIRSVQLCHLAKQKQDESNVTGSDENDDDDLQSVLKVYQLKCGSCGMDPIPFDQLGLLSSCGHTGCLPCLQRGAVEQECPEKECREATRVTNIVKAESLGRENANDKIGRRFGAKLERLVHILRNVIPEEEKVLVFVQFPDLFKKVDAALEFHDIATLKIDGSAANRNKNMSAFQASRAKEHRVLLLNAMDESASGANLVNANHVVFLSPLLTDDEYTFRSSETQAIGRVRRYGQSKTVHIWRMVTRDSIDEQIFEERLGSLVNR